jgi:hypothetical protein
MKHPAPLFMIVLFLAACAPSMQEFSMVRMDGKQTLPAAIDFSEKSVTVSMPDGQEMNGKYSEFSFLGSAALTVFSPMEALALFGGMSRRGTPGYAVLTDGEGAVMEVVFYTDKESGIGFAKTGEGEVYRFVY